MKIFLSLIFIIFSFNASSMEEEDIDKLKNQILECYDENISFAHDSFDGKILKFKILVNEDKTIKELTTEEENPYFLEFLNKVFEKPVCNNLILTDNGYEIWNEINFSFDFSWQKIGNYKCSGYGEFQITNENDFILMTDFSTGDSEMGIIINWGASRCENSASIFSPNGGTEYTFMNNVENFTINELFERFLSSETNNLSGFHHL